MYQKSIHKKLSVTLALLVLLSTVSFTMEKHFCGDTLVDVAIFTKVNTCGMDMETASNISDENHSCCKEELEVVKGQDLLKKVSFEDLHISPQFFLTAFVYSHNNLFEILPREVIPHQNYSPPNLVLDIQVLDQVFII